MYGSTSNFQLEFSSKFQARFTREESLNEGFPRPVWPMRVSTAIALLSLNDVGRPT